MATRDFKIQLQFLNGSSAWIDSHGEEHVRQVIEAAGQMKSPPVSVCVFACLTLDEVDQIIEHEQPQIGFYGGGAIDNTITRPSSDRPRDRQ